MPTGCIPRPAGHRSWPGCLPVPSHGRYGDRHSSITGSCFLARAARSRSAVMRPSRRSGNESSLRGASVPVPQAGMTGIDLHFLCRHERATSPGAHISPFTVRTRCCPVVRLSDAQLLGRAQTITACSEFHVERDPISAATEPRPQEPTGFFRRARTDASSCDPGWAGRLHAPEIGSRVWRSRCVAWTRPPGARPPSDGHHPRGNTGRRTRPRTPGPARRYRSAGHRCRAVRSPSGERRRPKSRPSSKPFATL